MRREKHQPQPRVLFTYWGRRGLSRFALDVAKAALAKPGLAASVSVSRQNESFAAFAELGEAVVPVDTFSSNIGALSQGWRIPIIRRQLQRHIAEHRPAAVIELMPHVWSSFVAPAFKAADVRYATIVHDAISHPGDHRSSSIERLTRRTLRQADLILTLSSAVAGRIAAAEQGPHGRIATLFHPDLDFGGRRTLEPPRPGAQLRLAFFGRIMRYKGLPLFLDMVEMLRADGLAVEVGVFGEGKLGASAARLEAMGAEVVNRWLTEAEIAERLSRFHAVVLSHTEASQSGVAAAAFGAGLPVIATPVGGIIEQVQDGVTGVLAARVDAAALAEAARRLALDPALYRIVCRNIAALKGDRSMAGFVDRCVDLALQAG
ncbi:MAG: glycosyltransferase [Pseudomonadota bacterium]|jgi:glycosyltransferase involved in cell wall biosynthesis